MVEFSFLVIERSSLQTFSDRLLSLACIFSISRDLFLYTPSPMRVYAANNSLNRVSKTWTHSDANIRNLAPVARIMKLALPENAKIAKEAKECMQECVSEFISFITSEGEF